MCIMYIVVCQTCNWICIRYRHKYIDVPTLHPTFMAGPDCKLLIAVEKKINVPQYTVNIWDCAIGTIHHYYVYTFLNLLVCAFDQRSFKTIQFIRDRFHYISITLHLMLDGVEHFFFLFSFLPHHMNSRLSFSWITQYFQPHMQRKKKKKKTPRWISEEIDVW